MKILITKNYAKLAAVWRRCINFIAVCVWSHSKLPSVRFSSIYDYSKEAFRILNSFCLSSHSETLLMQFFYCSHFHTLYFQWHLKFLAWNIASVKDKREFWTHSNFRAPSSYHCENEKNLRENNKEVFVSFLVYPHVIDISSPCDMNGMAVKCRQ